MALEPKRPTQAQNKVSCPNDQSIQIRGGGYIGLDRMLMELNKIT